MKYSLDKDKILLSVDKGEYINKALLETAKNNPKLWAGAH